MKKLILTILNDISIVLIILLAIRIADHSLIGGCVAFLIAYVCLDAHVYFAKKLNFYNNLFINKD